MDSDKILREQLLALLRGGNAHMGIEHAVKDFPAEHYNTCPPGVEYSFWHLLEHIRLCAWDILDFIRNPDYKHMKWPDDFWPAKDAKADKEKWDKTLAEIRKIMTDFEAMVENPETNFTAPLPHATDYNILREILLVADHNAYHIGEFGILRSVVGAWPEKREGI